MAEPPAAAAPAPWARGAIRVRAYFRKEVHEIRRQPLLILSLIVGPLLVLILFGASYQKSTPLLRTAIVLPPGGIPGLEEAEIRRLAGANFQIETIDEDRAGAEARLAAGSLEVVQVLPADIATLLQRGEGATIAFTSNAINPLTEGWVQYLAYAEVNEINKALLLRATSQAQAEAGTIRVQMSDAGGLIAELQAGASPERQAQIRADLGDLIAAITLLEQRLPARELLAEQSAELAALPGRLARLRADLQAVVDAIASGRLAAGLTELAAARQELLRLDGGLGLFVGLSPGLLVAPLAQSYRNIRGGAYSAVIYYAPGVLALLVQHTAITLGALALVRERLSGAFELFRVAPVHMAQLLAGKYLGYTLFIALSSLALIGAMLLLGVPLLGSWALFGLLLLLLTLASLGIGFLISAVAGSDSQAIQLAMITLLLSIFFSGFFISLDSFAAPALAVSAGIPMSHGVAGFQNLMLRGIAPDPTAWVALAAIALVSFGLVLLITRQQFRKA